MKHHDLANTKGNENTSPADLRRKKSAVICEISGKYFQMKKAILLLAAIGTIQSGISQSPKVLRPGGWCTYKLVFKDLAKSVQQSIPGMDPSMLAMLPPEQRAQVEAQMKQGQGGMQNTLSMQEQMLKDMDMKITYSVTGEEMRNGKNYIWLEVNTLANMPDMDKVWLQTKPMLQNSPPEQQQKTEQQLMKAKADIQQMPLCTKDGKFKYAMRMLMEKPDMNTTVAMQSKIAEIIERQGDNPPRKFSQEEVEKFNKSQVKTAADVKAEEKKADLTQDIVRIPGAKETPGMMAAASAIDAASGAQGSMQSSVSSIQQAGDEKPAGIAKQYTLRREIKPVGMEEITDPVAGKMKTLHMNITEVSRIKFGDADMLELEQIQEMWISPFMPGMGMVKLAITSKQTMLPDHPVVKAGMQPKPFESYNDMLLDGMGDTGAKSVF